MIGNSSEPLLEDTIDAAFCSAVARHPDGLALSCPDQGIRLTYLELDQRVERAARGLVEHLGLRKGDRLGCWLPNVYEYIILQYATARIGTILVTLNPAYRVPELKHALNLSGVNTLVMVPQLATSDYVAMMRELLTAPEEVPSLRHIMAISGEGEGQDEASTVLALQTSMGVSYRSVCEDEEIGTHSRKDAASYATLCNTDVINIQFTSGTTGLPKAVALSHYSLVNNGSSISQAQRLGPNDRVCIPVPLYHCFGVVIGSLACIAASAAIVLPCRSGFSPARTLDAVALERCTALYGVPTMFIAELSLPDLARYDLSSLRTGVMAGSLCPADVMERVHKDLGMTQVTIAYGMTETAPVSWQSHAEVTPRDKLLHTVGRVMPHVECKVVDSETGATVAIGERGELMTRGYLVMDGYWGDPAATAAVINADGWMRTGDLVAIDAEGYCSVVGRAKDLIIRGGENIAPKEIEDAFYSHEGVLDVSVIGVPDEVYGEQVCACVVLHEGVEPSDQTAEDLRSFCRGRLAHFKVPKYVRFVDSFPMTVSGKVQKFKLVSATVAALSSREKPAGA